MLNCIKSIDNGNDDKTDNDVESKVKVQKECCDLRWFPYEPQVG